MIINLEGILHPNVIKTAMLLVSEEKYGTNSPIYKIIKNLKLDSTSKVQKMTSDAMKEAGIQEPVVNALFEASCNLLLSLDDPLTILGEYVFSSEMKKDIKRKVDRYNNNKNSYDLNNILVAFKEFVCSYSLKSFNWDHYEPTKYLGNCYSSFFSQHADHNKTILQTINLRGSYIRGEEGVIDLVDKVDVSDNDEFDKGYKIDFSRVVKDISLASCELYSIRSQVIYDLFSFYLDEKSESDSNDVRELLLRNFNTTELLPTIVKRYKVHLPDYQTNTLKLRHLIVKKIYETLDNGLYSGDVMKLYEEVKRIDSTKYGDSNTSTLFVYPKPNSTSAAIKKAEDKNKKIFFTVLKGIVSLKEFIKYLEYNKIEFTDFELFRSKTYYQKFESLESYISMKEISDILSEESKGVNFELPYYKNEVLYDKLSPRYNLSSLFSIYNEHISKIYEEPNPAKKYLEEVYDSMMPLITCTTSIENLIEEIKQDEFLSQIPLNSPDIFDAIHASCEDEFEQFKLLFDQNDSQSRLLMEGILNQKDIYNVLRFLNFNLLILEYLATILNNSLANNEDLLLSADSVYLNLPKDITKMLDLTIFNSENFKLRFYLDDDEMVNESKSMFMVKLYSTMYRVIRSKFDYIFSFTDAWVVKFKSELNSFGVKLSKSSRYASVKLREKLSIIETMNSRSSMYFRAFANKYGTKGGLLAQNGLPIIYQGNLVHEKGYFLNLASDFAIMEINEEQQFDLKKVSYWRDVLWKV